MKINFIQNNFRMKEEGFTLLELLIYSAILVISAGFLSGIFATISRSYLRNQAENEINTQMNRLEELLRQNIEVAKGVNSFGVGGSTLELNMGNSSNIFSLNNDILYFKEGNGSALPLNDPNKVKVTSLVFSPAGGNVPIMFHYAWNDNVGWLDWAYPGGNVILPRGAGDLNGGVYILSDNSWVSLNCSFTDSCNSVVYKVVSDANGNLSGWAWSEHYGWISFSSLTDGSSYNYGVKIDPITGEFDGYAWSENIGWISFNCKTGGQNQTNICATSNYLVKDLRLNATAVKVDITLQYNSTRPEQQITKSNSFVFNILTPAK